MLMLTLGKVLCYVALALLHLLPVWSTHVHHRMFIGLLYLLYATLLVIGELI